MDSKNTTRGERNETKRNESRCSVAWMATTYFEWSICNSSLFFFFRISFSFHFFFVSLRFGSTFEWKMEKVFARTYVDLSPVNIILLCCWRCTLHPAVRLQQFHSQFAGYIRSRLADMCCAHRLVNVLCSVCTMHTDAQAHTDWNSMAMRMIRCNMLRLLNATVNTIFPIPRLLCAAFFLSHLFDFDRKITEFKHNNSNNSNNYDAEDVTHDTSTSCTL